MPQAVKEHDGYRHEALLWRGEDDFLDATVPFVQEGLRLGQPVLVAVIAPRIELLRGALGADSDDVEFVDMAQLGRNPAHIIPRWRGFIDDRGAQGQPVRGIGEPIWSGRRPAEVVECQLHEALLNLAVDPGTPLWLMCPYDVEGLGSDVVVEAQRSHPVIIDGAQYRGSTVYGGSHHVTSAFAAVLPEPPGLARELPLDHTTLRDLRAQVAHDAATCGLSDRRGADLALGVHEVAANSLRHGPGGGVVRMWRAPDALVHEVSDGGRIPSPMLGRTHPLWDQESGRGLWMAHQLCDLVQVRSGDEGTTIRIHTWL